MGDFYVYVHYRRDTNKPFYVGKGKGSRAYIKLGRSVHWQRVASKHGYSVDILFNGLTEQEAFDEEISVIAELRYHGFELTNHTNGGEGTSGYRASPETRAKISALHKGRIKSEQECLNISLANKGKPKSKESVEKMKISLTGHKQSKETIEKRKATMEGIKPNSDTNYYFFFNTCDVFYGTRLEFCKYSGISPKELRTLFQSKPNKTCKTWSVMSTLQLLFIKEKLYGYNCPRHPAL